MGSESAGSDGCGGRGVTGVGEFLAWLRKIAGVKLDAAAERTGYTYEYLRAQEAGSRTVTPVTLAVYAALFGVKERDLCKAYIGYSFGAAKHEVEIPGEDFRVKLVRHVVHGLKELEPGAELDGKAT